jgi:hypothetical protein
MLSPFFISGEVMAEEKATLGGRFLRGMPEKFQSLYPQPIGSSERFVLFATPTLDFRVSIEYLSSTIETEWALARAGIKSAYKGLGGDCFVDKARNRLVTEYLAQFPQAQDFFFLDDDIGWPAAKVIEFLNRPQDIVCGVYPRKKDEPEFPVTLEIDEATDNPIQRDGLYKAILVPTGFMRIKRKALEKLVEGCRMYMEQNADGTASLHFELFKTGINDKDGRWWGEDSWLCDRAKEKGIEIWVDPDIDFWHRGTKKWGGNFEPALKHWLKNNPPKAAEADRYDPVDESQDDGVAA